MISGFSDVSMTPQTEYLYLWRHQDTSDKLMKKPKHLWECCFSESQQIGKFGFANFGKRGRRKILKIRLTLFENLEYGINIILRT